MSNIQHRIWNDSIKKEEEKKGEGARRMTRRRRRVKSRSHLTGGKQGELLY
jgi:hypothetical protein